MCQNWRQFPKQKTNNAALRLTINKCNLMQLKSFFKKKDTIHGTEQQPTDWEFFFLAISHLIEGQYPKYMKILKKYTSINQHSN